MAVPWLSWIPDAARWLWNKIRGRPTVQADRGAVAAGRDQPISGAVVTGDRATAAASRELSVGQATETLITQIHIETLENLVLHSPRPPAIEAIRHAKAEFRASVRGAVALSDQGEHKQALVALQSAFGQASDERGRCALHFLIACELRSLGRPIEAEGEFRQAVRAEMAAQDLRSAAASLDILSLVALRNQNWRNVEAYSRLARRFHKHMGNSQQEATALSMLSYAQTQRGRPAAGLRAARQALELTTALPASAAQADALMHLGIAQFHLYLWDEAAQTLRWSAAMWRRLGDLPRESAARRLLELANEVKA